MNIRNKLLIQFSIFVVTILLIFSVGIFLLSSNYRVSDYYSRLQDKANTTAQLLLDVEEVDKNLLKIKQIINNIDNEISQLKLL